MRLHNLDLNLLVVLDVLMAEQSVSQTAQRLNMTQPAISNALARLRVHFKDELFIVLGRRMAPTPLCEALAEPVRDVVARLRRIAGARGTFDPQTAERIITVICSDYVFLAYMSAAIRKLAIAAPMVTIRTLLMNEGMPDLLRTGRADFAIVPERRMVEEFPSMPLFEDEFAVIAWTGNTRLGDSISREEYLSLLHVSTSIGPTTPPHIEQESLERHGVTRKIAVYAPNFTSVADVVVGTEYIATMHARSARILARRLPLRVLPPPVPIAPFTIALQWNSARDNDPAMDWMRGFLGECAASLDVERLECPKTAESVN